MTGRKRIRTAARVAWTRSLPWRICSMMNWTMRMAFLVDRPMVVRNPILK